MTSIGAIEDAIISRFTAAIEASALGYVPAISTYAGEFTQDIGRAIVVWPSFLVLYTGASLTKEARATFGMRHTFGVVCIARSLRNEAESRRGAAGEPGSYQLVDDVLALVSGLVVNDESGKPMCTPLVPRGVRPLLNDRPDGQLLSIYAVDFDTELTHATLPATGDVGDFNVLHTNWDVPVHGNVSRPLPADDTADATDHLVINPPQEENENESA